jgi:hypothetical protein
MLAVAKQGSNGQMRFGVSTDGRARIRFAKAGCGSFYIYTFPLLLYNIFI